MFADLLPEVMNIRNWRWNKYIMAKFFGQPQKCSYFKQINCDDVLMKKMVIVLVCLLWLIGCANKNQDPYAEFRQQTASVIFNGGERALAKGNYSNAVKHFKALDAIYPFGPFSQQGQLDIIYAYYKNDDDASAITAADRYTRLYPRDEHVDYAYYMRGVIGFSEGLSWLQKLAGTDLAPRDISTLRQSFSSFATLVQTFPDSEYSSDALFRMAYIRNLMARREIQTARFYMQHQAYVAAANRATYVVQHFEGSPEVIQALAIMVRAYQLLGLDSLAQMTYQVLKASYPESPELDQLENKPRRMA